MENINSILKKIYVQLGGNITTLQYADNTTILNEIAKIKGGTGNNTSSFDALNEIDKLI